MTITQRPYRHIESLQGACPVCDEVHELTEHHGHPPYVNKYGVCTKGFRLKKHGPRDNRCAGSHELPVSWLEASGLPSWDQMSDLDRGAALMHVWKRKREGGPYAVENYPVRYIESQLLRGLDLREACRHASVVCGSYDEACDRLTGAEVGRLYDLALNHERSAS